MRRSNAPSMLTKANGLCISKNCDDEGPYSEYEEEQYSWGSRNNNVKRDQNIRIYNVIWRDVSTRKHKSWKGDGTLEVNIVLLKAILKDEGGKCIGISTKIKINELMPDFQMTIGGKEIEIQNEISEDQLHELGKRRVENHICAEEEWTSEKDEEEKKPKGGFKFKSILVLNPPKITLGKRTTYLNSNWINGKPVNTSSTFEANTSKHKIPHCIPEVTLKDQTAFTSGLRSEYICFIQPSELQQLLFKKTLEYITSIKSDITSDKNHSLEIEQVLKFICNHPSLITHTTNTNQLKSYLIQFLPDWVDMGPFDSSKLEFVQYFLSDLSRYYKKTCIIFATTSVVLNMLQGLCHFMNIKCWVLNSNELEDIGKQVIKFVSSDNESPKVLLLSSVNILRNLNFTTYCEKLIFFEKLCDDINICALENLKGIIIYNLVTAFSVEELLLLNTYNRDNMKNVLSELVNITDGYSRSCYLHSKIECSSFESSDEIINKNSTFIKNWKHFKNPFDKQLLKISSLENYSENMVSIWQKNL